MLIAIWCEKRMNLFVMDPDFSRKKLAAKMEKMGYSTLSQEQMLMQVH